MKGDHKRRLNGISEDTVRAHVQLLPQHSIRQSVKSHGSPPRVEPGTSPIEV
jgi:hypothetical protein